MFLFIITRGCPRDDRSSPGIEANTRPEIDARRDQEFLPLIRAATATDLVQEARAGEGLGTGRLTQGWRPWN